ncbi:hypothetical protein [Trichoplusia ni ascovirus 2c]|uniref:hypothetical protein n=1 Tax=Trichoplusia ni ascovirus 2c TaxID=328615 RepID=UPI0000E44225|nr:hypothetical protein TNAV2c_gp077 [Trichoplusia ni ascovirus 2c]ABF70594.1 hypothetical protein [Trichoplusia ni ascovirus 2c]
MKLVLENFKSFKNRTEFSFPDYGVTLLSAPSGCGKSTIIESIMFAIYGGNAPGHFDNPKTKTTRVVLDMPNITIIRSRRPNAIMCIIKIVHGNNSATSAGYYSLQKSQEMLKMILGNNLMDILHDINIKNCPNNTTVYQNDEADAVIKNIFGLKMDDNLKSCISRISGCEIYETYMKNIKIHMRNEQNNLLKLQSELQTRNRIVAELKPVEIPNFDVNIGSRPTVDIIVDQEDDDDDVDVIKKKLIDCENELRETTDALSLMKFNRCTIENSYDNVKRLRIEALGASELHIPVEDLKMMKVSANSVQGVMNDLLSVQSHYRNILDDVKNVWDKIVMIHCNLNNSHKEDSEAKQIIKLYSEQYKNHNIDVNVKTENIEVIEKKSNDCNMKIVNCHNKLSEIYKELEKIISSSSSSGGHGDLMSYISLYSVNSIEELTLRIEKYRNNINFTFKKREVPIDRIAYLKQTLQRLKENAVKDDDNIISESDIKKAAKSLLKKYNAIIDEESDDEYYTEDDEDNTTTYSVVSVPKNIINETSSTLIKIIDTDFAAANVKSLYEEASNELVEICRIVNDIDESIEKDKRILINLERLKHQRVLIEMRDNVYRDLAIYHNELSSIPDSKILKDVYVAMCKTEQAKRNYSHNSAQNKAYLRKRDDLYIECSNLYNTICNLTNSYNKCLKVKDSYESIMCARQRLIEYESSLEKLGNDLNTINDNIRGVELKIQNIQMRRTSLVDLMQSATLRSRALHEWDMKNLHIQRYKEFNDTIKKYNENVKRLNEDIVKCQKILIDSQILIDIVTNNKNLSVKATIDAVNDLLEDMVNSMFDGCYIQASIKDTIEGKMYISISVRGNECKFECLSAGEAARINLAVKVALFKVAGIYVPLCLDECLCNLDSETARLSLMVVKNVVDTLHRPVFVVAHQCDEGLFDSVCRINYY